jgi:hypothetical protein
MDSDEIRRENDEAEQQLRQDIIEGEQIETMTKTKGWKMFEEEIKYGIDMYSKKLDTEENEKKLFKAQGAKAALTILNRYCGLKIEAGKEAKQFLEEGEQ